ncbi:MAG: ribonuclease R [Phycisphaerae bacterium]|nr:ribonuclease R [Phycisphaerae bacterium]
MSDDMPDRILHHLSQAGYRPQKTGALAEAMGIAEQEYNDFRRAMKSLMAVGRIVLGSKNAVMLPDPSREVVGTYRGNPRGFGFVVPQSLTEHGDLYIPEGESRDAITGDTVVARVLKRGKRGNETIFHGRIVQVLERASSQFVGQLCREHGRWFVMPDGKTLRVPVFVDDVGAKGAKLGDQVVVEILTYPSAESRAKGVIVERLGRRDDPGVDVRSIVRQYHIPDEFPDEVRTEALKTIRSFDLEAELQRREDLRNEVIVTIDPDTARDFDDAISLRRLPRGHWELGVHIADVAAFVTEGSELDAEARLRGNSVYLPQYVVPMLPESLSNGLCSLQQDEPRLAKSVFIRYGKDGNVLDARFANSVIRSVRRLTYNEATQILAGKTGDYGKEVVGLVRQMEELARVLQRRRLDEGMIVLDLPEIELELNDDGRVVDAHPADTSFSHTIIEMFMVEANEAVARLFDRLDLPFLRRIHPDPPMTSGTDVKRFVRVLGHRVAGALDRQGMIALLKSVRGRPEAFAVNMAILRSMEAATYSPQRTGHFALASHNYCHFTSPIRRYPDLTVHRLFDLYVAGRLEKGTTPAAAGIPDEKRLSELGSQCSVTERRAEAAEREARMVKVLELLSERIGERFDGVVTGVANVGVFVQCIKYGVDGLIRFGDLRDDWWDVDVRSGSAVGERTGMRITIGDLLQVEVIAVNVPARELDLALVRRPKEGKEKDGEAPEAVRRDKGKSRPPTKGRKGSGTPPRKSQGKGKRGGRRR